jgi:glycosyltransferase involved in cell wall biosynthesis
MNILIIAPFFPYPLTQGGKIVIFNTLKYLSRLHRVSFACLSDEPVTDFGLLQEYCDEIVVTVRKPELVRDLLSFMTGDYPFNAVKLHSESFAAELRLLRQRRSFDLVQVEFSLIWRYAEIFRDIPLVLYAHNIEYKIIAQNRLTCRNPLKRLLYAIEERKLRALEERAWRDCSLCFTVSANERDVIAATVKDDTKVITLVGVDLERFPFQPKREAEKKILFIGGLNYHPNVDSARYLLEEIFPRIRASVPDVSLDMVGIELWRIAEQASGTPGVRLHEHVPEILPWFRGADLLVVPLRYGAGVRIKILETMAAGLPIVATLKGCEGLAVGHGRELLVADDPDSFAREVVRLLGDSDLRLALATNAHEFVCEHYSLETVVKRMLDGFHRLLPDSGYRGA